MARMNRDAGALRFYTSRPRSFGFAADPDDERSIRKKVEGAPHPTGVGQRGLDLGLVLRGASEPRERPYEAKVCATASELLKSKSPAAYSPSAPTISSCTLGRSTL